MIIECKEYIDMIRMKELIGESRIIKDNISNSTYLLDDIKFCVFAEVLELTDGWAYLLEKSKEICCTLFVIFPTLIRCSYMQYTNHDYIFLFDLHLYQIFSTY